MKEYRNTRAEKRPDNTRVTLLVESARAGDRSAFAELVKLHQERIFRMAYYRTGSKMEAEDITQDIFTAAFTRLHTLRETNRFRPWLFSIAVNRIRDFNKKKRILVLFGIEAKGERADLPEAGLRDNPSGIDPLIREEFWGHVRRLMDKLGRGEREVFLLRFFDQLTIREIAQTLSKSESAVKTHLYRAVEKFRGSTELTRMLDGEVL